MTNSQLATASLNDIVFDGRNQGYGAYQLRALYQRHMTRALVIATALCALLLVFPLLAQLLHEPVTVVKGPGKVTLTPVNLPADPPVVVPPAVVLPPVQPPQRAVIKDVVPIVVKEKDAPADSDVPERDKLVDKPTGTKTVEGPSTPGPEVPIDLEPGITESVATAVVAPQVYVSVEQMPELPGGGGQMAIVAAIQRAVHYPSLALRNGVEGRVYASFTVNTKGEVVDLKIVKGLGSGLDEETLRAIKSLPDFIPGKQNGREVNVSFTVPITYRIQ